MTITSADLPTAVPLFMAGETELVINSMAPPPKILTSNMTR